MMHPCDAMDDRTLPDVARMAFRLPTSGSGGLQPGVDLEDKEAMAELLGDNEGW
jgi:hypothetical protein